MTGRFWRHGAVCPGTFGDDSTADLTVLCSDRTWFEDVGGRLQDVSRLHASAVGHRESSVGPALVNMEHRPCPCSIQQHARRAKDEQTAAKSQEVNMFASD